MTPVLNLVLLQEEFGTMPVKGLWISDHHNYLYDQKYADSPPNY